VNFRTNKPSYKSKSCYKNPPEKHVVFEGYFPAIIDRETWELAQKCRQTVRRHFRSGEPNPLTGLLFCADCGAKMTNHRNTYLVGEDGTGYFRTDSYECSVNRKEYKKYVSRCSKHHIRSVVLNELILDSIKTVSIYARENEKEFVEQVREMASICQTATAKESRRQFNKNERRIAELDMLFRRLYEDNATGKISDERFMQLSGGYESEQAGLKAQNAALSKEIDSAEENKANTDSFLELANRYTDFDVLTPEMLYAFVDKVIVYEADRSSGERRQTVDIHLNFVGNFKTPEAMREPTQEEIEAEKKRMATKLRTQKHCRDYRARKKLEQEALELENAKAESA
jgi:hypothetical protein